MYLGKNTSHGVSVEPARRERSAIFFVKEPKVLLQVKIIKGAIFIAPFIIQSVKEHSVKLSRNSKIYAAVEKTGKNAVKSRAVPAPCC